MKVSIIHSKLASATAWAQALESYGMDGSIRIYTNIDQITHREHDVIFLIEAYLSEISSHRPIKSARKDFPGCKVILMDCDIDRVSKFQETQLVSGVILSSNTVLEGLSVINNVHSGLTGQFFYREPKFNTRQQAPHDTSESYIERLGLSPQQARLFPLILLGISYGEIGKEIGLQTSSVKTQAGRIFEKANVSSKEELLRKFRVTDH
jgi:DNA-binding NarL/FixJ family response regulator